MAKTMARLNQNNKVFCALRFFMLVFFVQNDCSAFQFKVGGSCGWTIPNDSNGLNYTQWAEKNRFQTGDTLVFDYPANKDTVVQVTKEDYKKCHSTTPIKIFTDGHTIFKFNQSGPYYFISGLKYNCFKNEKLVVVVMADRSKKSSISMAPSSFPGSTEFKVGGSSGWTIPNDSNGLNYNQWAEKNRFQTGDTFVFDYPANKDTVVQVTKEDYTKCHSATPIKIFTDGHTVFKFNQSGPYYFISGLKDNCFKNEKLVVVVLADRRKKSSISIAPSSSSGSTEVPPVSTMSPPSPSPTNNEPPSPTMSTIPSSAPSIEDSIPRKSSAYSVLATLIGSIGALVVALFPFIL